MSADREKKDLTDKQMVAIPTASLLQRKASLADMYLKLPSGKLIKIAHKGGPLNIEQLKRYGDQDVKYFYIERENLSDIARDLVKAANLLSKLGNVPADLKLVKFFNISETVFTELFQLPISEESISRAIQVSQEIAVVMSSKPELSKLVGAIVDLGEGFSRHAMGTVIIANLLADQLGWESTKIRNTLSLGAFFHDIGKRELPPELLNKKHADMTAEEIQLYESHSTRGVSILNGFPFISADVLQIVQEHHELPNGKGFPSGLRGERMYPPSRVVSLANLVAHNLFDDATSEATAGYDKILRNIDGIFPSMFGIELTRALKKIFCVIEK